MTLEESLKKLFSLHAFGIKLGLENINNFLYHLNHPEKELKAFHVAGSNGKGSTSAFLASILQEFGYKTGLYTSPHFVRFNERIRINYNEIPDAYVAGFISKHNDFIDEHKLTFFEVTTAMAFQYFADNKVEYAVIETGLGGRLDATNVLNPLAAVITSISLEHTNILGADIASITAEKADIIKDNIDVFIGKLPDEAVDVIEKKCEQTNSALYKIEDYTNEKPDRLELYTEEIELDDWTMPLKGDYQKYNAALAALAVTKVLDLNDFNLVSAGIKNVISNTGFQGRYEFFRTNPDVIFDSAHNLEGIEKFLSEFRKEMDKYSIKILLFCAMNDKPVKQMLRLLREHFEEIHVTEINYERSLTIDELIKAAKEIKLEVIPEYNSVDFVRNIDKYAAGHCLVVLGSMYMLGEIKSFLQSK